MTTSSALDDKANTELINISSSWCCSSEDDSIGVREESVVLKESSSSRGRSRSSKNSQSLYAKVRINLNCTLISESNFFLIAFVILFNRREERELMRN